MELLKNYYSKEYVAKIADIFAETYPKFNKKSFLKKVFDKNWSEKELKERMRHLTICTRRELPEEYEKAIWVLKKAAPKTSKISKHSGFLNMFFPDFVELYGINDWEVSMEALKEFTKYSSSEFAVRPFIVKTPERMMAQMSKWTKSDNYHVRRLTSEGCRPRLPWAMALPEFKRNPAAIIPVLEELKDDESEYVRRSVANNLNDISKDNPEIVINVAKKWLGFGKNRDKLVKHACRTLLKAGNQEVLKIFGYGGDIEIEQLKLDKQSIKIGENLTFNLLANIKKSAKIRLEYAIFYKKANGSCSKKVFQLKEGDFSARVLKFTKKHSFKQMTTRKHYVGEHFLAIIINGVEQEKISFMLKI